MSITDPAMSEKTSKFLNSREWRTFLSSAQSAAASYPSFMAAVRAGQAWLGQRAAQTYGWLSSVDDALATGSQKTLGI
ncbi:MAG TPA: hypothetical protein VHY75_02180 [Steroidobacteraceae bacterium]|nr:hypothetical protein [Steroidobacteraceae bacterium]